MLKDVSHQIIQSRLAGFDEEGIGGIFKVFVVCEDLDGVDKTEIRIDRLVNRDGKSVEEAKKEVIEREQEHLKKFKRLYVDNDQEWVYWKKEYYDLVINSFSHNEDESLEIVLNAIGVNN